MTIDKLNHAKAIAAEIDMLDEQMRRLGSLLRNEENGAMLSLTLVKKGITLCSVRIDNLTGLPICWRASLQTSTSKNTHAKTTWPRCK